MIAVITAKRDGADYLTQTLASIDESNPRSTRVVIADSLSWRPSGLSPMWDSYAFNRPKTERNENRWAFFEAMRLATESSEDLVFFEDDVILCRNGARYMEYSPVPDDLAWVSFFDPWLDDQTPEGMWRRRAHAFGYCQALKLPLRTCKHFVDAGVNKWASIPKVGADNMLADYGHSANMMWGLHSPSIVQHIGASSFVGNGTLEGRTSKTWRRDRDAFDLHPMQYL